VLGTARRRDLLVEILEQVRRSYKFVVVGYVVMPEHVHLLLGEPDRRNPSVVVQVLKQRLNRRLLRNSPEADPAQGCLWKNERPEIWQRRFYDFVV